MKTENKQSLMVWVIVILAIMNISTLITIFYHQYQSGKLEINTVSDSKQLEANSEKYSGRYFRDQLKLNSEQMDKFRVMNPVFRQQARAIVIELSEKRKKMLIEMAAKNSNIIKLDALSDSIGNLHSRLKKLTCRYYLDLKNICNHEQQIKLEQLFSSMFLNDSPMGLPGRGGPKGWQHGRPLHN